MAGQGAEPPRAVPPESPRVATAVALLAASTLTVMAPTIVAPALPSIAREFAAVPQADVLVPLVLTLPALVVALTASAVGLAVDRLGRRPVLLIAIVLYGAAGGTGLFAGTLPGLLAGRIGLGLAVAATLTAVTTVIADLYQGPARARMLSRQAAVMGASGTVFTLLSGVLAGIGWRWSFLLYPLAWLLLPVVASVVPETRAVARPGTAPAAKRERTAVPGPGTVTDATRAVPLHPSEVFRPMGRDARWVVAVSIALLWAVQVLFYLLPVQLPFVLEEVFGLGPAATGAFIAVPPLAYAGASLLAPRLAAGRRRARVVSAAFAVTGVGYLAIGVAPSLVLVAIGLLIGGAGLGLSVPNLVGWVAQASPARLRGRLMGGMTAVLFLGQFLSPLVWSPVVSRVGRQSALTAGALTLLALAVLAFALDGLRRRRDDRW